MAVMQGSYTFAPPFAGTMVAPSGMRADYLTSGLRFIAPQGPCGLQGRLKRGVDVVGSLLLIALVIPIIALVAITIRLDSPGPVVIRQLRLGRRGIPFQIFKFRSMVANADQLRPGLDHLNEATPPLFKIRRDPRLTRMGRHLRRLSLDELPQLLNVLLGQMSLVGPRPPFATEVHADVIRQSLRLKFPPGMTGLWQVSGRSNLDYESQIRLDLLYTREWSFWLDLKILFRTLPVVIGGKGAY